MHFDIKLVNKLFNLGYQGSIHLFIWCLSSFVTVQFLWNVTITIKPAAPQQLVFSLDPTRHIVNHTGNAEFSVASPVNSLGSNKGLL